MTITKIIFKYCIVTFTTAYVFVGCTIQPKERQFNYVNDSVDNKIAYRESKIQLSKCLIEINKIISAPMPTICDEKNKSICEENNDNELKEFNKQKEQKIDECMKKNGYRKSYFNW